MSSITGRLAKFAPTQLKRTLIILLVNTYVVHLHNCTQTYKHTIRPSKNKLRHQIDFEEQQTHIDTTDFK